MSPIKLFQAQLEKEAAITRKMLSAVPNDKYDWKPHEKSMSVRSLATHIAELPGWITMVLNTTELDFAAQPYQPEEINNTTELLAKFERDLEGGKAALATAKPEQMEEIWTLRNGENIYAQESKFDVIQETISQIIHHRAQLGVVFRLLDVPVPATYGPSADDNEFE